MQLGQGKGVKWVVPPQFGRPSMPGPSLAVLCPSRHGVGLASTTHGTTIGVLCWAVPANMLSWIMPQSQPIQAGPRAPPNFLLFLKFLYKLKGFMDFS